MRIKYTDLIPHLLALNGIFSKDTYWHTASNADDIDVIYIWNFPNEMKLMIQVAHGEIVNIASTFCRIADQPDQTALVNWLEILIGMWQANDDDPGGKWLPDGDEIDQKEIETDNQCL